MRNHLGIGEVEFYSKRISTFLLVLVLNTALYGDAPQAEIHAALQRPPTWTSGVLLNHLEDWHYAHQGLAGGLSRGKVVRAGAWVSTDDREDQACQAARGWRRR